MSKIKVLAVDDEQIICDGIKLNLEAIGDYEVHTETQGSRVLEAALTFKPDIIFLDFIMPDLDGADAARQIQENAHTKHIPIIFLTAIATKDDSSQHGNVIGGIRVIPKPASTDQIIAAIKEEVKK